MKIVFISDTHGQHGQLNLPAGDIIIHCGDVSKRGGKTEIQTFLNWFAGLDFQYKIFIAGNHDFFFEDAQKDEIENLIPENIIYLNDSGITVEGIKIWGSPVQPWFYDWAFNRKRGKEIKKHWDLIPADTDILITHGPPFQILDKTKSGEYVGCEDLLYRVTETSIRVHAFGHIHEAYGEIKKEETTFINASVLDERYNLCHEPIVYIYP